ncbi:leucine zipper EF-hand transmembrane-like protein [Rhizoctonia solani AG-3 Rhs1AP]|uniref:Mitochondrial proton/calcium exchanger protein n=1 Tax=Rhizoctonia solani AG-3 Rhs1AP TaxID=1086054 RepID=X8JTZ1_9AGAM|nr:leucine zipper EF-hand transmembrane-like protein [Rhizoctonia solani AG-3 Rhs1AP]
MSIWIPRKGGDLRPMVMSLANLSRPGYRFKLPSQQSRFLYESLNYSMTARRLASTSTEGRDDTKPNTKLPTASKTGKPGDSKSSALFSPTPSKPASLTNTSTSPVKSDDNSTAVSTSEAKPVVPAEDKSVAKSKDETKPKGRLAKTWAWIKHEANHYWDGSKLLAAEVRVSSKLLRKVLNGARLTRRERRQLTRTTNDLLRLIPFAVFVLVPFMEILLPVALKLFPNMLPSTFEDKFAAQEKQRKLLKVRLEMAKFLQDTLKESPLKSGSNILSTDEFKNFFLKVRSTGESPSVEEVVKVAKLFDTDLTLDNLSRPQLVSICRYMGLNAFGTDNFLRYQIRSRLVEIRRDDEVILNEGVDSLSTKELQHACQSRGLRTIGVSPSRLREEMGEWIDLHLTNRVSGVLLILSRAFMWDRDGDVPVLKGLESVMSSLPDTLLSEAELEVDSEKASYKQKLEVLQQQEELIDDEAEQEAKEEDVRRQRRAAEERAKREEEALTAQALLPESELQAPAEEDDARMTTEQLTELGEALSILSAKSSVIKERDELRALMEENQRVEEENAAQKAEGEPATTPSNPLIKKIRAMLTKVDQQLEAYDTKVGSSLQMITCDSQGKIPVHDLERALRVIKHAPGEDEIEGLVHKLDVDHDGYVVLEHVLGLVREEGLGIVLDDEAKNIVGQGREIIDSNLKPKKEDIVQK